MFDSECIVLGKRMAVDGVLEGDALQTTELRSFSANTTLSDSQPGANVQIFDLCHNSRRGCWSQNRLIEEYRFKAKSMAEPSILVIDDELETVELVRAAFKRRGCHVIGAMNGQEGLRLAREHCPAVILIDLMLPGINGFELCRQLRRDPLTQHIPQVILSARESTVDQADALAAGADRYLVKPVRIKSLVSLVESLIA